MSEYDDNAGKAQNNSTASPAPQSMQLLAQSALDLLDSAQFNYFVKRVNTATLPLPNVEKLDVGLPIRKQEEAARSEKLSMGLDIGIFAGAVQQDGATYFDGSGKDGKADKDVLQESFLRAIGEYNEDASEAPTTKPDVKVPENNVGPKLEVPGLAVPTLDRWRSVAESAKVEKKEAEYRAEEIGRLYKNPAQSVNSRDVNREDGTLSSERWVPHSPLEEPAWEATQEIWASSNQPEAFSRAPESSQVEKSDSPQLEEQTTKIQANDQWRKRELSSECAEWDAGLNGETDATTTVEEPSSSEITMSTAFVA